MPLCLLCEGCSSTPHTVYIRRQAPCLLPNSGIGYAAWYNTDKMVLHLNSCYFTSLCVYYSIIFDIPDISLKSILRLINLYRMCEQWKISRIVKGFKVLFLPFKQNFFSVLLTLKAYCKLYYNVIFDIFVTPYWIAFMLCIISYNFW